MSLLLPTLILGGVGLAIFDAVIDEMETSISDAVAEMEPIGELQGSVFRTATILHHALLEPEPLDHHSFSLAADEVERLLEVTARRLGEPQHQVALEDVSEGWLRAWTEAEKAFEARRVGDVEVARLRLRSADAAVTRTIAALQALAETVSDEMAEHQREVAAKEDQLMLLFGVCLMTALGLLLLVVMRLRTSVFRPLRELRYAAARFSEGDLSYRVTPSRPDEFGDALQTLNEMAADLEKHHEELSHRALHDPLTDLPNRVLFADRVTHAITRCGRRQGSVGVIFLDLDDFKHVNDTLGHVIGDQVLIQIADRLHSVLRAGDTPARLGGDEFAVLVEDVMNDDDILGPALRIRAAIAEEMLVDNTRLTVGASVGIALSSGEAEASGEQLMIAADLAMYSVKRTDKGGVTLFAPHMHQGVLDRMMLAKELDSAVSAGQIVPYYQPLFDIATGEVIGMETLVRWHHPTRGTLSPAMFLDLAEENGIITTLGREILAQACHQARIWGMRYPDSLVEGVSVNLSARQLRDPRLLGVVENSLRDSGLASEKLTLEITEDVLMQDLRVVQPALNHLKGLGVRIAIDDFGTGRSSLAHLRRMPLDTLKIDKAFVATMEDSTEDEALIRAILRLGNDLGLEVVAEGIERSTQAAALERLGCLKGQGYLCAQPLDETEFEALLVAKVQRKQRSSR